MARFFREQSARHGVVDLEYTPIAWTLSTTLVLPELAVDEHAKLSYAASRRLVGAALKASEGSLGATLQATASALRKDGFAEVAFLLHLPRSVGARDFAYPAYGSSEVDVAVVFDAGLSDLGFVGAHEALHLFGSDDLYPLDRFDEADDTDIMRDRCAALGGSSVRDMTAYAVGWRKERPRRAYR